MLIGVSLVVLLFLFEEVGVASTDASAVLRLRHGVGVLGSSATFAFALLALALVEMAVGPDWAFFLGGMMSLSSSLTNVACGVCS